MDEASVMQAESLRIPARAEDVPLVSVVMPSLNQASFIEAAMASVLGQSHSRLELLVQDGGSTDGTLDILRRLEARDARLRWVCAADAGPADAVNKAILRARGTVIGWLNSDDLYAPGAIERAVAALQAHPRCLAVYGHGAHVDEDGHQLAAYPTRPPATGAEEFLDGCFICQPTLLFRRSLFCLLGPLDADLRAAFDFEYWLRLFSLLPERIGFVDAVQAHSRLHPGSITRRMRRQVALEGMLVLNRHLRRAPVHWALTHLAEIRSERPGESLSEGQRSEIETFVVEAAAVLAPHDAARLRAHAAAALHASHPAAAGLPAAFN
jgi:glycosyltransferase involved in cell wall biosynthesis